METGCAMAFWDSQDSEDLSSPMDQLVTALLLDDLDLVGELFSIAIYRLKIDRDSARKFVEIMSTQGIKPKPLKFLRRMAIKLTRSYTVSIINTDENMCVHKYENLHAQEVIDKIIEHHNSWNTCDDMFSPNYAHEITLVECQGEDVDCQVMFSCIGEPNKLYMYDSDSLDILASRKVPYLIACLYP